MNVLKISPMAKQNIKIAGISTLVGANLALIGATAGKVMPKDIFQYGKLSSAQKCVVNKSALGGLIITTLLTLYGLISSKNVREAIDKQK